MCGIAGIWKETPVSEQELCQCLDRMLCSIAHRGPDDGGMAVAGHIALGNRRLSIFDLSAAGNQPFFNEDGQIWLVFNGEIYNHPELRKDLEQDFSFKSSADTEVLLRAYEKWGISCLERMNGMFAFAIWDARIQTLFLCRDRIGIKPLYYWYNGRTLYFASEIKALLAAGMQVEPEWSVWKDYLFDGYYDHTEKTFFRHCLQVRQGHYLAVTRSGIRETCYWNLQEHVQAQVGTIQAPEEEYRHLLEHAVSLRMRADVPYAVMLSGGLDSSVIATLAEKQQTSEPLHVCTIRYKDARFDEGGWADLLSKDKAWQKNDVLLLEQNVQDMFVRALWHQDEPFGSAALIGDMLIASKARERGILVLLEGQGADEALGGYEYCYAYYLADLYRKDSNKAKQCFEQYAALRGIRGVHLKPSFERLLHQGGRVQAGVSQDGTGNSMSFLLSETFSETTGTGWCLNEQPDSLFETVLYRDLTTTKVPRVLRFKDRASMMFGVELRVPFLDHRLLELSFQIPAHRKIAKGYTKYCLRAGMERKLPHEICYHIKRQLQTPQGEWLRHGLRPMVEEVINSSTFKGRGVFDVDQVKKTYRECIDAPERYPNTFFIWQWLQLEWWFRIFVDRSIEVSSSTVKVKNALRAPTD